MTPTPPPFFHAGCSAAAVTSFTVLPPPFSVTPAAAQMQICPDQSRKPDSLNFQITAIDPALNASVVRHSGPCQLAWPTLSEGERNGTFICNGSSIFAQTTLKFFAYSGSNREFQLSPALDITTSSLALYTLPTTTTAFINVTESTATAAAVTFNVYVSEGETKVDVTSDATNCTLVKTLSESQESQALFNEVDAKMSSIAWKQLSYECSGIVAEAEPVSVIVTAWDGGECSGGSGSRSGGGSDVHMRQLEHDRKASA